MFESILPNQYVALRLPSDAVKVEHVIPNTTINLGKYGSFRADSIIGRPYNLTFELVDRSQQKDNHELRIIPASEIHAETLLEDAGEDLDDDSGSPPTAAQFDEYGLLLSTEKSNVNIIDNTENQKLTFTEIEALKSEPLTNPKDLIAKIMANHSQIDQKTAFSLAKYILRKRKKYMKRFTVLPLDVATLTEWMMNEKDFAKVMEIRNETLGLIGSWANVHAADTSVDSEEPQCRYLVVDDTSGLITAALAERMGILHYQRPTKEKRQVPQEKQADSDYSIPEPASSESQPQPQPQSGPPPKRPRIEHPPAKSNTITLVHANQQPNLSLLRYFSFDPTQRPSAKDASPHPLHTHLNTLTWLQLLYPKKDTTYTNKPEDIPQEKLDAMKTSARSDHFRKLRRWTRTQEMVNTAHRGKFDALIVASLTDPVSICKRLVPLLAGGAQVVVYHSHIEPLMELCDAYSTSRRAAYVLWRRKLDAAAEEEQEGRDDAMPDAVDGEQNQDSEETATDAAATVTVTDILTDAKESSKLTSGDPSRAEMLEALRKEGEAFQLDPTLLLTPALHHSVVRPWQVLPGRTHPLMTYKGGAEGGYVLVSTRVKPLERTDVQARGRYGRKKKKRGEENQVSEKRQKLGSVIEGAEGGQIDGDIIGDMADAQSADSDIADAS